MPERRAGQIENVRETRWRRLLSPPANHRYRPEPSVCVRNSRWLGILAQRHSVALVKWASRFATLGTTRSPVEVVWPRKRGKTCWIELVTTRVDLLFRFRRRDYGSAFLETVVGRAQPELNDHGPSALRLADWIEDKPLTGSEVWSTACLIGAGHPDISIRPPSEDGRPHCFGCPTSRRTGNRGTQLAAIA